MFPALQRLGIKNPHCTYWGKIFFQGWQMGREKRCSVKCKHLLAAVLHPCCAHKADPMEGGEREAEDAAGSSLLSTVSGTEKREAHLAMTAAGFLLFFR